MRHSEMVREFHEAFGLPIRRAGDDGPDVPEQSLRFNLLLEEFIEYANAYQADDLVEVADALADMLYIIHGTSLAYGIDIDAVFAEVHRSNMTKLDENGRPIFREDGKVLKPAHFEPPRIAEILGVPA